MEYQSGADDSHIDAGFGLDVERRMDQSVVKGQRDGRSFERACLYVKIPIRGPAMTIPVPGVVAGRGYVTVSVDGVRRW